MYTLCIYKYMYDICYVYTSIFIYICIYTWYIPTIYMVYHCYIHGISLLFAILLRILTTSRSSYIDMKPIAYPPRNSRSSGHLCTLKIQGLIPFIYNSIMISQGHIRYTMMFMVYTSTLHQYTWFMALYTWFIALYTMFSSKKTNLQNYV